MPDQYCFIRSDPLAFLKFHPVFALAQSHYEVVGTVQGFLYQGSNAASSASLKPAALRASILNGPRTGGAL